MPTVETRDRARQASHSAIKVKTADAWEVAADAWEECGAPEDMANAEQARVMAQLTREGKNPSIVKLPDGSSGILHDEPSKDELSKVLRNESFGVAGPSGQPGVSSTRTRMPKNAVNKGRFARRT